MDCQQIEERVRAHYPTAMVRASDLTGTSNHFEVVVSCPELKGKTRLDQHRAILEVFQKEMNSGEVHALCVKTL